MALHDELNLRKAKAAALLEADEPRPRSGTCLSWALLFVVVVACIVAAVRFGLVA